MNTTSMSLVPIQSGWAVMLSDGRELARFTGIGARQKAYRYIANASPLRRRPRAALLGEVAGELGGWRAADSAEPDEGDSSSPQRP